MSFPPNLGITNSFIIDSSCSLFQEFPSLLPHLDHICSPFSKHKMNGYSRIKKSASTRSKSLDFADLSLTRTPPNLSKFKPTPDPYAIPEHEDGEAFGVLLGCVSHRPALVKRSASVTDGYSRIHNHAAKCGDDHDATSHTHGNNVKKKGKFFRAFKRIFGL